MSVTQQRTVQLLDEIQQNARQSDDRHIQQDCNELQDGYPRYREAKKSGPGFEVRPSVLSSLSVAVTPHEFVPLTISVRVVPTPNVSPSRAPPLHA
jgi:hypothetical protein